MADSRQLRYIAANDGDQDRFLTAHGLFLSSGFWEKANVGDSDKGSKSGVGV